MANSITCLVLITIKPLTINVLTPIFTALLIKDDSPLPKKRQSVIGSVYLFQPTN